MARAIFYTRQTRGACAGVCACDRTHQMEKTAITSQKLGSRDFWRIANSVLNKGKSAIPPLFNGPEVLSFASDKAK